MPAHVLLVDALELPRLRLQQALQHDGYRVTVARSALEAVALLHNQPEPFDAVVSAEALPPVHGSTRAHLEHTLGLLMMARMSFPALRLLLLTNEPTPELERRAHVFGVHLIPHTGSDAWACVSSLLRTPGPKPRNVLTTLGGAPAPL